MIELHGVSQSFNDLPAISNISCTIREGTVFGLLGSNGAGKSTLLRILAGVIRPDSGSVTWGGQPIYENPALKGMVAFVPDVPYFLPQATMRSMAAFYARFYPSFDWDMYHGMLSRFSMAQNRRINTFSKGMERQAALALMFAIHPKLLLLDEAFDGLDAVVRRALRNLIAEETQERGMTVISASHSLRELEDICDEVALMHRGGLLFCRQPEELRREYVRFQVVYDGGDAAIPEEIEIVRQSRRGRLITLVARGDEDEVLHTLRRSGPVFVEALPLTLEEALIQELEVAGYDAEKIFS